MRKISIVFLLLIVITSALVSQNKTEIIKKARASVVRIQTFDLPDFGYLSGYSTGSGYVVEKGYVITNNHVIKDARGIVVYSEGNKEQKPYYGVVVRKDTVLDIALLRVFGLDAEPLQYADTNEISQADEVLVLGYPGASYLREKMKATWGLISSDITDTLIQTTAAINRGNSGGPAINLQGKVIGTVRAKIVGYSVENVGLIINNKYVKEFINYARPGTETINDYFGTKNLEAYKKYCDAEMIKLKSDKRDSLKPFLPVVDSSITFMKEALGIDGNFTAAKYYLASYYLESSLIHCSMDNEIESGEMLHKFNEQIAEVASFADTNKDYNKFSKLIFDLSKGDGLDCDEWSENYHGFMELYSMKNDRIEEFDDYINSGRPPELLKKTLDGNIGGFTGKNMLSEQGLLGYPLKISLASTLTYSTADAFKTLVFQSEVYKDIRPKFGIVVKDKLLKSDKIDKIIPIIGFQYSYFEFEYTFSSRMPGVFNYRFSAFSDYPEKGNKKQDFIHSYSLGSFNCSYEETVYTGWGDQEYKIKRFERAFGLSGKVDFRIYWNIWSSLEFILPLADYADKNACLFMGLNMVL